jgi:lipoyl(octanoyl) transferase
MPERIGIKQRSIVFRDLGILEYNRALALQVKTRAQKTADPDLLDQLFFVQHPPVFTFGKNGGRENLVVSDDFLSARDVATVQTDRGGNVTYHGPGQAVLYPIVDLEKARIGVADFVQGLEEIMLRTVSYFGVTAARDSRNHGLWVGPGKIGSVGLSIKKGISIHGLALNINPDLTPFSWINPCGMENVPITSIEKELNAAGHTQSPPMNEVKRQFINCFCNIFNYKSQESTHV